MVFVDRAVGIALLAGPALGALETDLSIAGAGGGRAAVVCGGRISWRRPSAVAHPFLAALFDRRGGLDGVVCRPVDWGGPRPELGGLRGGGRGGRASVGVHAARMRGGDGGLSEGR